MIVTDTSVVLALHRLSDPHHEAVTEWYRRETWPLVTTPLAVAEMDHMLRRWGHPRSVQALRTDLASTALGVTWWPTAMSETLAVALGRPDLDLADASLVALAAHRRTNRIATLDHRSFRSLKPLTGEDAFILLPADAD